MKIDLKTLDRENAEQIADNEEVWLNAIVVSGKDFKDSFMHLADRSERGLADFEISLYRNQINKYLQGSENVPLFQKDERAVTEMFKNVAEIAKGTIENPEELQHYLDRNNVLAVESLKGLLRDFKNGIEGGQLENEYQTYREINIDGKDVKLTLENTAKFDLSEDRFDSSTTVVAEIDGKRNPVAEIENKFLFTDGRRDGDKVIQTFLDTTGVILENVKQCIKLAKEGKLENTEIPEPFLYFHDMEAQVEGMKYMLRSLQNTDEFERGRTVFLLNDENPIELTFENIGKQNGSGDTVMIAEYKEDRMTVWGAKGEQLFTDGKLDSAKVDKCFSEEAVKEICDCIRESVELSRTGVPLMEENRTATLYVPVEVFEKSCKNGFTHSSKYSDIDTAISVIGDTLDRYPDGFNAIILDNEQEYAKGFMIDKGEDFGFRLEINDEERYNSLVEEGWKELMEAHDSETNIELD